MCPLTWAPLKALEKVNIIRYILDMSVQSITYYVCVSFQIDACFSYSYQMLNAYVWTPVSWIFLSPFLLQVHVNLLVMEARLQAELLYALRAITQYMIA